MDASIETVGARLRRLRIERGLSQRSLATQGVSYAYISRIEAGARTPSVKALRMLARRLGVSVDYLETGLDLAAPEDRELRLREAELHLRLGDDPASAETVLRALVDEAENAGDITVAMRARTALGMTAQRRADHHEAIAELERVLTQAPVPVLEYWDVYRTLGRSYAAVGRAADAVALFERCLEEIDRVAPDDDVAYARCAMYLSYALSDLGELPRARETVAAALRRAGGVGDALTRVRLYWSYARLALTEQRPRVALENLRRAVSLLETTEDTRELARAHLFWAEIVTFDHRPDDALPHLALAERLLGPCPDPAMLALLRTEQARAAAEAGSPADAIRFAREALELIGDGDLSERATALWALGQGLAEQGEIENAVTTLNEAIDLFEDLRAWLEAAGTAQCLGRVLRDAGRESDALNALERSVGFATRVDAGARRATAL